VSSLSKLSYEVVGLDWTIDPVKARGEAEGNITFQGNFDPCGLYSPPEKLDQLVKRMVGQFGRSRWIANLGHGIYPDIDPEHVTAFIEAVHKHTKE